MKLFKITFYIFLATFFFVLSMYFTMKLLLKTQDTVTCPDIVGKEINEAKKILESKGLLMQIAKYEKRNDIPYNHITVQKPAGNINTKKGRTVLVVVSDGPELIPVPQLVGQEIDKIQDIIKDKKITVKKILYVPDDSEGRIIAQIPKANETIQEGKGITLFVGKKPKRYVVMPEVKGMTLNEIKDELMRKNISFKITFQSKESNDREKQDLTVSIPKGNVFSAEEGIEIKINTWRDDG